MKVRRSVTAEFRHGTIRPTFLATPRRSRVITAKLLASAAVGIALGFLAQVMTIGVEVAGLAARGIPIEFSAADYAQFLAGGLSPPGSPRRSASVSGRSSATRWASWSASASGCW
ncbi:MAG: hypothetical protein JST59_28955 [Actinobacteria bacterium]|nr:hypothetical protein [Actinomycetota bacterium]